jgi:ferredoxin
MAFVVCEPCIRCRYTDCVEVCPVNCFHEGSTMLVIDPEICIDCGVCVDECPTSAIYPDDEVPPEWAVFIAWNRQYSAAWPVIRATRGPLPSAAEYEGVRGKTDLFSPEPGGGEA